ncbi:MAG: hypothetical protein M1344_04680 [Candidatus Thermoplasmatota archaeon]|nr:hypothetical protein [Candidatus Thermoplasmatota archaeon]
MRKNVFLAGILAIVIGLVMISFSAPVISNFIPANMHYSSGYYSSTSIHLVSNDVFSAESPSEIYLVPYASVLNVTKSDFSTLQVLPTANTSMGGLTTKTWSGLDGNYSLISFSSSSVQARYSIMTSSSQSRLFAYSIAAIMGVVLFMVGIISFFAGLVLRKKSLPVLPGEQPPDRPF